MPGFGKSGTSRIKDLRWSILSFYSKRGIRSARVKIDFFQLIHDGPLRPGGEIVFERFNIACGPFYQRFNCSVRTVANVPDNLMPCSSALREETITNSLHVAFDQKFSRYLHLKSCPSLPFSNVNVSSSEFASFNVNVILSPLIEPV